MRRFFRSKKFIVTASVTVVLAVLIVIFGSATGWASPQSAFMGYIATPVQKMFVSLSDGIDGFFKTFSDYDRLEKENAELREQIEELTEQKLEWQEALNQNEFYKDYLGIKEEHDDFEMCSAKVVSRDVADPYGTFTVDVGSLNGISPRDPVMTAEGVIGYVGTVGPTYCTVVTVLDPSLKISAYDRRTGDSGVTGGNVTKSGKGTCRLNNLSRYATVTVGDYFVTTGGGVFPRGLILGTVESVSQNEVELTLHADITPAADIFNCSNVMIITSFSGQSSFDQLIGQE